MKVFGDCIVHVHKCMCAAQHMSSRAREETGREGERSESQEGEWERILAGISEVVAPAIQLILIDMVQHLHHLHHYS